MDEPSEIRFDGWTLKRASGELLRDGTTIQLQPQPLRVLEELLAHPGEVVTREHLTAQLWPTGVVDFDTALNSAVRRLRRVLRDDPDQPRYIQTIPRKGYRFIGSIEVRTTSPAIGLSGVPRAAVSGERSGAPEPSTTRRLQLALMTCALFAIEGLLLVGDSRAPNANTTELATASVRSAASGYRAPQSTDSAVEERLRRARYFLERRANGDLERARKYFEEAVGLDPTLAQAYAGLASVYWLEIMEHELTREIGLPKLKAAADRALSLDPREIEAHYRLALYSFNVGDTAMGADHMRRAQELDPDNPVLLATRSGEALTEGDLDEAVQLQQQAVTAAPLNLSFRYNLANTLYLAGRFDESAQAMRELLEMDPQYRADILAYIWILRGRYQEAIHLAQSWTDTPDKWESLALAYFGLGALNESDRALARLIAAAGEVDPLRIVEVYAYRRDVDRAVQWLKRAKLDSYGQGNPTPWLNPSLISLSPFVASLRGDPRWEHWLSSRTAGH